MRSSDPNFYSSSSGSESSTYEDEETSSGINQIISGVKNTLSLNLSRSKSNKSENSGVVKHKGNGKTSKHKSRAKQMPYNSVRPINGKYKNGRGGDYSSGYSDDDSESSSDDDSEDDSDSDSSSDDDSSSSERDEPAGKSKGLNGKGGSTSKNDKGNESAEDYSDDEDEGEEGYKVGGYHRVKVGEVYNQRLVIRTNVCTCVISCNGVKD